MSHMLRFVKSGTSPNVLGLFGPHVCTEATVYQHKTACQHKTTCQRPNLQKAKELSTPPDVCISGENDGGNPQAQAGGTNLQPPNTVPDDEFTGADSDEDQNPPPNYNTWGNAALHFVEYVTGGLALAGLKLYELNNALG